MSAEAEAETQPMVVEEESMDVEVMKQKAWEDTTVGKWGLRLVNLVLVVFGGAVLALVGVSIFSGQTSSAIRSSAEVPACLSSRGNTRQI